MPGHVEAAEGMSRDGGAGALAVNVQVADMELTFCALDLIARLGVDRASQAKFGVIGNLKRVIVILRLDDGQERPDNILPAPGVRDWPEYRR